MNARTRIPCWLLGALSVVCAPGAAPAQIEVVTVAVAEETPGREDTARDGRAPEAWRGADERVGGGAFSRDLGRRPLQRLSVDEGAVSQTMAALGEGFRRSETTHFVILSDCPGEWTWSRAALLERARHQFFRAASRLHIRPAEHTRKLLCVLINDHQRFREFGRTQDGLDAGWVAGYYAANANRIVFYNDAVSPEYEQVWKTLADYDRQVREARGRADEARASGQADAAHRLDVAAEDLAERVEQERSRLQKQASDFSTAKTIHEAVHLLAFNTGMQRRDADYPFWLSEGFAASFETNDAETAFGPDRSGSPSRRARLKELSDQGRAPRLGEVVMLSRTVLLEADAADAMYAMSSVLFEHLYRRERTALSLYLKALGDQAPRRLTPQQHLDLFVQFFGDPGALERRVIAELR